MPMHTFFLYALLGVHYAKMVDYPSTDFLPRNVIKYTD